jgi:molybdopterin-guanine dinucleotide biosynthesis protein A
LQQARVPTLGTILAGGLARRMGGDDKALLELGGATLVERVIQRLGPQCDALILNANGDPARFAPYGLTVVADSIPDFAGPLAGILIGMDWAAANRPDLDWIVTASTDTPFLPPDLVERLHEARATALADLACARSGDRNHNVDALWPVRLRDDLRAALIEGTRRVDRWTARYRLATAEWPTEPVDPFFNVNTPEDFAAAERLLARNL